MAVAAVTRGREGKVRRKKEHQSRTPKTFPTPFSCFSHLRFPSFFAHKLPKIPCCCTIGSNQLLGVILSRKHERSLVKNRYKRVDLKIKLSFTHEDTLSNVNISADWSKLHHWSKYFLSQ